MLCYTTAYLFAKAACRSMAVIELATGDKIGYELAALLQLRLEQPVLTVYLLGFCSHTQCYNFQIRKAENVTRTRDVALVCNQIT